ncbi:MAG: VanZ family protein [Clostridia bacterium]|nr:VanZ family protein [Clostridia bacterium]
MLLKTRRSKIITVILLILIILTVAFIWSNSLKDSDSSHSDSNVLVAFFRPVLEMLGVTAKKAQVYFIRKGAHLSEFFLLGSLFAALLSHLKRRWTGLGAFVGLSVAVLDEYIQSFSDRTSLISDVLIDFSGYAAGFAAVALVFFLVRDHRKKREKNGVRPPDYDIPDIVACTTDSPPAEPDKR